MGRAFLRYLEDLQTGSPIALGLTGFFVLLALLVLAVWLIDLNRRRKEKSRGGKRR